MKKLVVLAAISALFLTGCSSTPAVEIPSVVGMAADEAADALTAAGMKPKFPGAQDSIDEATTWTVDSQSPKAGTEAKKGSEVELEVSQQADRAPIVENPVADAPTEGAPKGSTSLGLDVPTAITACDQAGKDSSPYGWTADFLGAGTQTIRPDDVLLTAAVTITSEYGTPQPFEAECIVGGTNDAPVVSSFDVK